MQSYTHIKRVKNLTEAVKALYPTLNRIPREVVRNKCSDHNENTKRQAAFDKANATRLTKSTINYFLNAATFEESRRGN